MIATANGYAQCIEPVLKRLARKYSSIGLAIAVVFHFAFVGAYWTAEYFNRSHDEVITIDVGTTVFVPPPTITDEKAAIANLVVSDGLLKPERGVPVPVPDALVSIEKSIPNQSDYNHDSIVPGSSGDNGTVSLGILEVPDDGKAPPDTFRPVQQPPQVVNSVTPDYPELARRAGIEGRVIVKMWIDKDGRPHQASVLKTDAEILNQSAIDAAMATRFSPAIMNNGPVSVWVIIPFVFRLRHGL